MRPDSIDDLVIAVIGLDMWVCHWQLFSRGRQVIGFDINEACINALREGYDTTAEFRNKSF